ncbi:CHAD domain-containing protein [Pseudonocardia endophytica]|uniref:CYTH and CHAD domain-containing protein n=1 Tax=Pseudonocardia endophytica TaxID=401976 RepID=UPI00104FC759|nr:CHAD domain-containing protein [Pseudonocardia endophytica]
MTNAAQTPATNGRAHEARAPDTDENTGTTYRGPAHPGAPRLTGLDGVDHVEVAEEGDQDVLEHERFDTADLRLAGAGIVLAVVRLSDSAHWELRLPDSRPDEQLRVPVAAPDVEGVDPDQIPEEIDALIRGVRRGRPVAPVGRIKVVRGTTRLIGDGGREVATIARDEVQVSTLGESTTVENWSEAEVQAGVGTGPDLLRAIDERVRETGLTPAPHDAEAALGRMLAELSPPAAPRWTGKRGSAATVLLTYVGTQVDRLAAREQDLRTDEPDAVHQLRVAARRIRSALRTYRPLVDDPRTDHLVAELRWLGRALADDRDAEVLEERITGALHALPEEQRLGPVQAQVTRHFARRRAEARASTLEVIDGERYEALRAGLQRFLVDPPLSGAATKKAEKVLPALAGRTARRLAKRMDAAVEVLSHGEDADEAIHRARKTGKQVRYSVEVVRPVGGRIGKQANAFRKRLKELQDELGAHQDTVVARHALRELGAQAGAENQNGYTFGILHGRDEVHAREIEERLPETWGRIGARKHRRWMS